MDTIGIKMIKDTEAEFPMYQTEGSVGMDLCSMDTVTIEPLDRVKIHTGIYIELPEGYEAQIRPRSGLACKHGITVANAPGTIDNDYRGEIIVCLINLSKESYTVNKGDRIAQMVVAKYSRVNMINIDTLTVTERGNGGFGSTGV